MHVSLGVTALALLLAAATGCSSDSDGRVDGPLLTSVGGSDDGMAAIVRGRLSYERGCVLLGGVPVVWPELTKWNSDREALRLPSGDDAGYGTWLTGGGGYLSVAAVRDAFGDDVADAAQDCLGSTDEIAVFNPGSVVALGWCTERDTGWQCMYPP
jgi:hypothetical protein